MLSVLVIINRPMMGLADIKYYGVFKTLIVNLNPLTIIIICKNDAIVSTYILNFYKNS